MVMPSVWLYLVCSCASFSDGWAVNWAERVQSDYSVHSNWSDPAISCCGISSYQKSRQKLTLDKKCAMCIINVWEKEAHIGFGDSDGSIRSDELMCLSVVPGGYTGLRQTLEKSQHPEKVASALATLVHFGALEGQTGESASWVFGAALGLGGEELEKRLIDVPALVNVFNDDERGMEWANVSQTLLEEVEETSLFLNQSAFFERVKSGFSHKKLFFLPTWLNVTLPQYFQLRNSCFGTGVAGLVNGRSSHLGKVLHGEGVRIANRTLGLWESHWGFAGFLVEEHCSEAFAQFTKSMNGACSELRDGYDQLNVTARRTTSALKVPLNFSFLDRMWKRFCSADAVVVDFKKATCKDATDTFRRALDISRSDLNDFSERNGWEVNALSPSYVLSHLFGKHFYALAVLDKGGDAKGLGDKVVGYSSHFYYGAALSRMKPNYFEKMGPALLILGPGFIEDLVHDVVMVLSVNGRRPTFDPKNEHFAALRSRLGISRAVQPVPNASNSRHLQGPSDGVPSAEFPATKTQGEGNPSESMSESAKSMKELQANESSKEVPQWFLPSSDGRGCVRYPLPEADAASGMGHVMVAYGMMEDEADVKWLLVHNTWPAVPWMLVQLDWITRRVEEKETNGERWGGALIFWDRDEGEAIRNDAFTPDSVIFGRGDFGVSGIVPGPHRVEMEVHVDPASRCSRKYQTAQVKWGKL
jgi:hypothetical protein